MVGFEEEHGAIGEDVAGGSVVGGLNVAGGDDTELLVGFVELAFGDPGVKVSVLFVGFGGVFGIALRLCRIKFSSLRASVDSLFFLASYRFGYFVRHGSRYAQSTRLLGK